MAAPTANLTRDDVYKLFEEIVDKKVGDLRAEFGTAERRYAGGFKGGVQHNRDGSVTVDESDKRGLTAARFVRYMALAGQLQKGGKNVSVIDIAKGDVSGLKSLKNERIVRALEAQETKALEAQDPGGAGLLIPEPIMAEITELLRAAVVVDASGAMRIPMPAGTLRLNFQSSASTATYVGERKVIPKSQPGVGRMSLAAKKLAGLVPISNDLLRFTSELADTFVRQDLVQVLSLRQDLAFIRDDGSQDTPKGLRHLAAANNVYDRSLDGGNVTLQSVTTDLAKACEKLDTANVKFIRPGWLMHPRTRWFLEKQRDGLGNRVWAQELRDGTLFGFPYRTTTQIPTTLGGTGDRTEIYFADFGTILIGDTLALELRVSDQASYDDSGTRKGFESDETIVRAIAQHDIGARQRGVEIAVVTAVDWIN